MTILTSTLTRSPRTNVLIVTTESFDAGTKNRNRFKRGVPNPDFCQQLGWIPHS